MFEEYLFQCIKKHIGFFKLKLVGLLGDVIHAPIAELNDDTFLVAGLKKERKICGIIKSQNRKFIKTGVINLDEMLVLEESIPAIYCQSEIYKIMFKLDIDRVVNIINNLDFKPYCRFYNFKLRVGPSKIFLWTDLNKVDLVKKLEWEFVAIDKKFYCVKDDNKFIEVENTVVHPETRKSKYRIETIPEEPIVQIEEFILQLISSQFDQEDINRINVKVINELCKLKPGVIPWMK